MNRSANQRSEGARRLALVALEESRQLQRAMLDERATMFESETRKVQDLRAQRLARIEAAPAVVAVAPHRAVKRVRTRKSA